MPCPTKAGSTPASPQLRRPLLRAAAANSEMVAWKVFGQDVFLKRERDTPTQSGGEPSAAWLDKVMKQMPSPSTAI